MSDFMIHPGISHGPYPERDDPPTSLLDATLLRAGRALIRRKQSILNPFTKTVAAINKHSDISSFQDEELRKLANELSMAMRRNGQTTDLLTRCCALVKEATDRRLGLRFYDEQLLGGWAMIKGQLAEMQTGEGKTVTAVLPVCVAALSGVPVHVVTINDYLVSRDAEFTKPLYEFFGLTVGTITEGMDFDERRAAYACDITYCTQKQIVFDYLKDRLVMRRKQSPIRHQVNRLNGHSNSNLLLRGLCFAVIDEADSVLIDEARTPLVLSRPGDSAEYKKGFIQSQELAGELQLDIDFQIQEKKRQIALTDHGKQRLAELAATLEGIWCGTRRREELVRQSLEAQHLYHRDKHYLVRNGGIHIIDESTGRVMADRSWDRGLHQMIQAKENCEISVRNETLIRISYQRFFGRYLRLAGMSGTLKEVAPELAAVYGLKVVAIPPHKSCQRSYLPDRVFRSQDDKWLAVVESIQERARTQQPVLVGTRTVLDSEQLSERLSTAGIAHKVLNARQDEHEAQIIAAAGRSGSVTVATNMAGRGTDIVVTPQARKLGGLHVILTERHEAGRIDRQLAGRSARQGDPGSVEVLISLQDELPRNYLPEILQRLLLRLALKTQELPLVFGAFPVRWAQLRVERLHARKRADLQKVDQQLEDSLAFAGRSE